MTSRKTIFDNRRVLVQYCQDEVTVLRQACQIFRLVFMEIGNINVFIEALVKTSACNKVLRKKFLRPEIVGLFPPGVKALISDVARKP